MLIPELGHKLVQLLSIRACNLPGSPLGFILVADPLQAEETILSQAILLAGFDKRSFLFSRLEYSIAHAHG